MHVTHFLPALILLAGWVCFETDHVTLAALSRDNRGLRKGTRRQPPKALWLRSKMFRLQPTACHTLAVRRMWQSPLRPKGGWPTGPLGTQLRRGGGTAPAVSPPPTEAAGGRLGSQIQEIARGNAAKFFVRGCDTAKPTNRDNQRNDTNLRNHVLGGQSPTANICIVHQGISVQANPLDSSVFQFWA